MKKYKAVVAKIWNVMLVIAVVTIIIPCFISAFMGVIQDTEKWTTKEALLEVCVVIWFFAAMGGCICIFRIGMCSYMELGNGKMIISRRNKDLKEDNCNPKGRWKTRRDEVRLADIVRIGYSQDICGEYMEYNGSYMVYIYSRGEVIFETSQKERAIMCTADYSRKELQQIFQYIYNETGIIPEGKLKEDLKIFG